MNDLFELSMPWWEFGLRAAIVYFLLLFLVRLSGKRTIGEFTPFDLIVVVLLGEAMQGALTGGDEGVAGPAIVAATLVVLSWSLGFLATRSKAVEKVVTGEPTVLLENGRVIESALKRCNVPASDVDEALRREGLSKPADAKLAVLETSGEITIVPKSRK